MDLPEWATVAGVLATGVAVSGVADFLLSNAGYEGLGALVWGLGYAGTLAVVWLGWVRHIEFGSDETPNGTIKTETER